MTVSSLSPTQERDSLLKNEGDPFCPGNDVRWYQIRIRCLPHAFQGRWAARWLQLASPAYKWCIWSSPYLLSMVILAYTGSVIQQPVLYNSTLWTILTPKSNPLGEGHIDFPGLSALPTKYTQHHKPKQSHSGLCLRQDYFSYALWDFIHFYRTRNFWLARASSISTASGVNYLGS